ncbi:hypothetical protein P22_0252 [Propionispora sp. 2/2-37]|uniref:sulfur carrier protein ThiS n=1 Tax=Propionispora sp. 2/2-37 TaxID=1677858 RepID=UPI0006BB926C|nr:sulfur carrier protein ThiS [Propionispora sp. 2/2-37]CUH94186.1 hypothetical protein P22_0252 [Propionispora sp. 2/2-37]
MKVNGKNMALEKEQTLFDFLTSLQFDYRTIAIEHNGVIIPETEYKKIRLSDQDILEIVHFVGGG